jgi:hypothetical protein
MRIHSDRLRLNRIVLAGTLLLSAHSTVVRAADPAAEPLPFAADTISRLSLDGKPRSLAVRQGTDIWLGYDLERATVFKAWRASQGKSGFVKSGFTTRSTGQELFEDATDARWELRSGDKSTPLKVRYLGCSHRKGYVELRWELHHDAGALKLYERVSQDGVSAADRVARELRFEELPPDDLLLPPASVREAWKIHDEQGTSTSALRGGGWHRLTLP